MMSQRYPTMTTNFLRIGQHHHRRQNNRLSSSGSGGGSNYVSGRNGF